MPPRAALVSGVATLKCAVVIGFATVDYVLHLEQPFRGTGTAAASRLPDDNWPRPGGAALYASRQLASQGINASPITWVGADDGACRYATACELGNVGTDGIARLPGGGTPTCVLLYQPDGDYGCLFSDTTESIDRLTARQVSLIGAADLVIAAAAPSALAEPLLGLVAASTVFAWIAKEDHTVFPADVRRAYAARADYIFCNAGERAFVDDSVDDAPRSRQVIVETRGADGVVIDADGVRHRVAVTPMSVTDATGAGDTLAGATMAQVVEGEREARVAVEFAVSATAEFLAARGR